MNRDRSVASVALVAILAVGACANGEPEPTVASADSAFAALQERGEEAMGVDQYTSTHQFDALPDGGRIELQRDVDDPEGVAEIRRHLREIATAFGSGNFDTPAFVHMQAVPGTAVMAAKKDVITYTFTELPRGGDLRIVTSDEEAIRAIHEFMEFQRMDHRAGGNEGDSHHDMDHGAMDHDSTDHDSMDHGALDHEGAEHGGVDPGSSGHGAIDSRD